MIADKEAHINIYRKRCFCFWNDQIVAKLNASNAKISFIDSQIKTYNKILRDKKIYMKLWLSHLHATNILIKASNTSIEARISCSNK